MRQIRLFEHVSLDNVIEPCGPGVDSEYAHGGWMTPYRTAEGAAAVAGAQGPAFDLLLGRRTYDLWAGYWPSIQGGLFADSINRAKKYVATHRAESLGWGPAEALGEDIVGRIRRLKSEEGPDLIVWGSATLAPLLLENGLVDEMVLAVYPLVLGRGKRCFSDHVSPRAFTLVRSTSTASGVLLNVYRAIPSGCNQEKQHRQGT